MATYREVIDGYLEQVETIVDHVRQLLAEAGGEGMDDTLPPTSQRELFGQDDLISVPGSKLDRSQVTWAVNQVIEHYRNLHPKAKPGDKERGKIRSRLKEGYSVKDLCEAIDGCHKSPYHCGENESGTRYQNLELIVRDSKRVHQFLEFNAPGSQKAGRGSLKGIL